MYNYHTRTCTCEISDFFKFCIFPFLHVILFLFSFHILLCFSFVLLSSSYVLLFWSSPSLSPPPLSFLLLVFSESCVTTKCHIHVVTYMYMYMYIHVHVFISKFSYWEVLVFTPKINLILDHYLLYRIRKRSVAKMIVHV